MKAGDTLLETHRLCRSDEIHLTETTEAVRGERACVRLRLNSKLRDICKYFRTMAPNLNILLVLVFV